MSGPLVDFLAGVAGFLAGFVGLLTEIFGFLAGFVGFLPHKCVILYCFVSTKGTRGCLGQLPRKMRR